MKRKNKAHAAHNSAYNNIVNINSHKSQRKQVVPKNLNQKFYLQKLDSKDKHIVFAIGPAGTGKSYCAAAIAADALEAGRVERVILTRPAVEAGEQLGFLPGDVNEKFAVYIEAFRDTLNERLGSGAVDYYLRHG